MRVEKLLTVITMDAPGLHRLLTDDEFELTENDKLGLSEHGASTRVS